MLKPCFRPSYLRVPLFAAGYAASVFLGIRCAEFAGDPYFLLVRGSCAAVSNRGLVLSVMLPFLFSAIAVFISKPILLIPVSLIQCAGFSMCCMAADIAFGAAGWLVRLLLLFSDFVLLPVLPIASTRILQGKTLKRWYMVLVVGLSAIVGIIDWKIVSPFLATLLET